MAVSGGVNSVLDSDLLAYSHQCTLLADTDSWVDWEEGPHPTIAVQHVECDADDLNLCGGGRYVLLDLLIIIVIRRVPVREMSRSWSFWVRMSGHQDCEIQG